MPPWEAVLSEPVSHRGAGRKDVAEAWLVTLKDVKTGTEHIGRVEVSDWGGAQPPPECDLAMSTEGRSAFDRFLNDQTLPVLIYVREAGIRVPQDGISE
jgi:hypothetical protein